MAKQKHHVFSARTTEEGLRTLNQLKEERGIGWDELVMIFEAATGIKRSKDQLQRLANHITQQTRAYNRREGLDDSTDTLPKRFFREKTREGAEMTEEELRVMVREYNEIREGRERSLS